MDYTQRQIAAVLDYTVLSPLATINDIKNGATLCNREGVKSFCVASTNVEIAADMHPNVSAMVGFPHGNQSKGAKYHEGCQAIWDDAKEIDVVVNYGLFLGGDTGIIFNELDTLCDVAKASGVKVKAILESCYYTPAQLAKACQQAIDAGVDWLKTSTGFGKSNATTADVTTMLRATKDIGVEVEASGGIKTYAKARMFLDIGCTRIGSSHCVELYQ